MEAALDLSFDRLLMMMMMMMMMMMCCYKTVYVFYTLHTSNFAFLFLEMLVVSEKKNLLQMYLQFTEIIIHSVFRHV